MERPAPVGFFDKEAAQEHARTRAEFIRQVRASAVEQTDSCRPKASRECPCADQPLFERPRPHELSPHDTARPASDRAATRREALRTPARSGDRQHTQESESAPAIAARDGAEKASTLRIPGWPKHCTRTSRSTRRAWNQLGAREAIEHRVRTATQRVPQPVQRLVERIYPRFSPRFVVPLSKFTTAAAAAGREPPGWPAVVRRMLCAVALGFSVGFIAGLLIFGR